MLKLKLKLKLIPRPGRTLLAISLLSPLSHAADVPAAAGHYLTLYAAPGVPQDDDPYSWSTAGGKLLAKGVTKADGRAYVMGEEGEDTYILKTVSMRWQLKVPAACWQGAPDAFQQCMQLTRTTSRHDEEQDARTLAEQQKEVKMQARIAAYAVAARANDDALAWLGRLPPSWTIESYGTRLLGSGDKIAAQIGNALKDGGPDARQFVCRAPVDYGSVPDQAAVEAWMALPSDVRKVRSGSAWDALVAAGEKGNWMARLELYYALSSVNVSELSLLEQYRIVQLMEWLHKKQVGGLYGYFSAGMPVTPGNLPSATWRKQEQASLYAAMLGSYEDQNSRGSVLQTDPDPALADAGRKMLACAKAAMPDRY
ncbi:hypothetical protein VM94_04312 [Janthinobacterium sp. KBS0711]|uniref:hypothetical protein n=1 Tax=Janthinobacterium sp. KBS0711 TaxID=1649647 RepID=UPI00062748B4|nr:hypothetical protein [Janthinobacterium sp. KBS0711]KKO62238.1 hypothetical protein VM94_04312 [Janthinobacterium sp. KBS0711]TSD72216.1 hypothetical protein FFI39_015240 [Janthinobacterium sp. KBS0711]